MPVDTIGAGLCPWGIKKPQQMLERVGQGPSGVGRKHRTLETLGHLKRGMLELTMLAWETTV